MSENLFTVEPPEHYGTPALNALENPRERAFVLHYVLGEDDVRGVLWKCYALAWPDCAKSTAQVNSSYIMKKPRVRAAVEELRREMDREARATMKSWAGMAKKAQELMDRAIDTMINPKLAEETGSAVYLDNKKMNVIRETLDRALGRPKEIKSLEVSEDLDDLIRTIHGNKQRIDQARAVGALGPGQVKVVEPPPAEPSE